VALGLLVALAVALGYSDLRHIRSDLTTARDTLQQAINDPATLQTAEGRTAAIAEVDSAQRLINAARSRTRSSAMLTAAKYVPLVRAQRSGLLQLVDDAGAASGAGRALLTKVNSLADANQLRDGLVPLGAVRELNAELQSTGGALSGLVRSPAGLWGPVGDARRRFDTLASNSASRLSDGSDAVRAALSFGGANGDRRYLIAVLNNAEMRDGGAVLQYVIARFTGSRLSFERSGSVGELSLDRPTSTPLPPGTQAVFGPIQPTQIWQSVNATADFALSGRSMVDMYRQATGQSVDGVIAIDVPGLAALLQVVGPVTVAGIGEPVTAMNVSRILLHDLYDGLPPSSDQTGRREHLGDVTSAVITSLTTGSRDAVALGRALGDSAKGSHLRLWSRFDEEESVFEHTGLGGGPATASPDRTFHLAVENRTATKLDYYVKPSVRQEISLSKTGTAVVTTTVSLDNQAPVQSTPSYQLGPDQFTKKPGDYVAWVLLWGPAGSTQASGGVSESGLNLSQRIIGLAATEHKEVTFETVIPHAVRDGKLELRLVPQARLEPVPAQVKLTADGWHVHDALVWQGVLDRVQNLTWHVSR
jgi:hypothetical protein